MQSKRAVAEAANHLAIGLLQGLGFLIALAIMGVLALHPVGLAIGAVGGAFLIWRWRKSSHQKMSNTIIPK